YEPRRTSLIMAMCRDSQIAYANIITTINSTKYMVHKFYRMTEIFETNAIYRIEYQLIINVQKFRGDRGWSQRILSGKLGFTEAFVGKCESLDQPEKYNLRHIGLLKKVFSFKSLDDLFPDGIPKDEQIVIRYKKVPKKKADGSDSKIMENVLVEIVVVDGETKAEVNKQIKKRANE